MKLASRRYANALFDYAVEQGQRQRISDDLATVAALLGEIPEMANMAAAPSGARQCRRMLEQVVSPRIHPITWRFILLLEMKRRLALLREVAEAFALRCEQADGIVSIRLASSHPLDAAAAEAIGTRIGAAVSKRPRIQTTVQPELLGGFVARHDDRVYDFSLAGATQQLRLRLASDAANTGTAR